MEEAELAGTSKYVVDMSGRQAIQILILGLAVGLLAWGFALLLQHVILKAILCGGASGCTAAMQPAGIWASILAACVALFAMVRLHTYRPLLVVLAAMASLWGLGSSIDTLPWYLVGAAYGLLYGIAYLVFAWIARIRLFWLAVCLLLAMLVAVRLLINS